MGGAADQDWGPTVSGRGRRRRGLRLLALVVVLSLAAVTAGLFWASSRIPRIEVDELAGSGRPMHVLVVGSDSREELTEEQRRELSTGGALGDRTDTIFIMTIRGSQVALLAFPRDLLVERCDGSVGRINAAEAVDGPSCLVRTVRDLSGIDVQHYVRVTFGGFQDIVDAVGGVELCLEEAISDQDARIDLPSGCQRLDGADALGYVRVRKIDDDLQRIQRQQQFLRALAGEVATPSTLFNPMRMTSLSNEVGDALTVDRGMGVISLTRLALGARGLADGAAVNHTVPADPGRTSGGAEILNVRQAEAEALFARFRDGTILDETDTALTPEEVRVAVLNGAGISGLANQVGDVLEGRGYEVVEVGNADARDTTVVRHPPGAAPAAELVARDVPGSADIEETSDVAVVTLILGPDAAGSG